MRFPCICNIIVAFLFVSCLSAFFCPARGEDVAGVIEKMEAAYEQVKGYRAETEVTEFWEGRVVEKKRFLYTFKKPGRLRIDMESPRAGMVLIYPDERGKVFVRPGGWSGFVKLHLSPDNTFLRSSTGQRIDQTDLGLLIRNIDHSLTDRRRGEVRLSEGEGTVIVEVLADDHFLAGVQTLYRFSIDAKLWLPVGVEEFTPERILKRKVVLRNLTPSDDIPDSYFLANGGDRGDGRAGR